MDWQSRYDEQHWFALEASADGDTTTVTARARVAGLAQDWTAELPAGEVELRIQMKPPAAGFSPEALGGDRIRLFAAVDGEEVLLTELDGRYWTAETCASFTGRVAGLHATTGAVTFADYRYRGSESSQPLRHGDARA